MQYAEGRHYLPISHLPIKPCRASLSPLLRASQPVWTRTKVFSVSASNIGSCFFQIITLLRDRYLLFQQASIRHRNFQKMRAHSVIAASIGFLWSSILAGPLSNTAIGILPRVEAFSGSEKRSPEKAQVVTWADVGKRSANEEIAAY